MNTITERKFHCLLLLLLFALLMMAVCSISLGRYYISPVHVVKIILAPLYPMVQDWSNQASSVIYTLRLPRALAAMMIGAALSLSGASYQSVFYLTLHDFHDAHSLADEYSDTIRRRKSYVRETQRIPPVCSDSLRHHSDSLLRLYQRDHWLGRIGHSSLFSHDGRTG